MKLFFKNTYLPYFSTRLDYPFFYSTYYAKKSFIFLLTKEEELLKQLSSLNRKKDITFPKLTPKSPYKAKLLNLELNLLTSSIENISAIDFKLPFYAPAPLKAKYLYLNALISAYKTDFNTATKDLNRALKIYKKHKHFFECAQCYIELSKIYKICGCFDITTTLLLEAEKILLNHIFIPQKLAEIKAYLGLNELQYENYSNAISYLKESISLSDKHSLIATSANSSNWLALAYFLNKDYEQSLKTLNKITSKKLPLPTLLFKLELLARLHKDTSPKTALKHLNQALKIAQKLNNTQELFELNFLKAEIYYSASDYQKASLILTDLINKKSSPNAPYFKANAYSLLGLIALKLNNLKRAKNLIKTSLDLELSKSRFLAVAIDYNNLSEVEKQKNQTSTSIQYLKLALDFAKSSNDRQLISYLEEKLSSHTP